MFQVARISLTLACLVKIPCASVRLCSARLRQSLRPLTSRWQLLPTRSKRHQARRLLGEVEVKVGLQGCCGSGKSGRGQGKVRELSLFTWKMTHFVYFHLLVRKFGAMQTYITYSYNMKPKVQAALLFHIKLFLNYINYQ